jgi:hypothetical protein
MSLFTHLKNIISPYDIIELTEIILNNQEFSISRHFLKICTKTRFLCLINFLPICSLEGGSLKRQSPGDALWRLGMASGVLTIPKAFGFEAATRLHPEPR